jgi:nicotinamide-nucleotide amidase
MGVCDSKRASCGYVSCRNAAHMVTNIIARYNFIVASMTDEYAAPLLCHVTLKTSCFLMGFITMNHEPLNIENYDDTCVNLNEDLRRNVVALGAALRKRGWTVSCAESCTGGGIAFAFTSASGSSDWFNQSWVTYSNDAKHTCLNVKEATLTTHGAVSQETVAEMATGAQDKSQANLVVTVSGIAGPGGGSTDKPVGTVWFGFICGEKKQEIKKLFSGGRDAVRAQAVRFAIAQLLTMISE